MHLDGRSLPRDSKLAGDVCIVGAGAAGITLARELGRKGVDVVLLESGGFELESDTQELYAGSASRDLARQSFSYYLSASRLRFFGGTTNHWAGTCRPLDAIDFEARPWVARSGWPLGREELDRYSRRAAEILEIAPFEAEAGERSAPRPPSLFPKGAGIETTAFHASPPTRFGKVYRDELVRSEAVRVVTHANVLALESDADGGRLVGARVATLDGNRFAVEAKLFVLAAGGIENARLLLLSDGVHSGGLGNRHDLVGRCFMDHAHVHGGWLALQFPQARLGQFFPRGRRSYTAWRISDESQRRLGLLNTSYRVVGPSRSPDRGPRLFTALDRLAREIRAGSAEKPARGKEIPAVSFLVICEQAPNPDSRVTLGEERDALGQRRVRLDLRLAEADLANLGAACRHLALELGRHELGRVAYRQETRNLWPGAGLGNHHMGTTRMHDDPKQGVVDRNARVHGIANLWVAGSSVFPTSGCSNPTFTIVALTLRLAEHLHSILPS